MESDNIRKITTLQKEHDQKVKELKFELKAENDKLTQEKKHYQEELTKTREKLASIESNEREQTIKLQRL